MNKRERHAYILREARELAKTGKYDRRLLIEMHLRSEGFPEARQVLDNDFLRKELDQLCRDARKNSK